VVQLLWKTAKSEAWPDRTWSSINMQLTALAPSGSSTNRQVWFSCSDAISSSMAARHKSAAGQDSCQCCCTLLPEWLCYRTSRQPIWERSYQYNKSVVLLCFSSARFWCLFEFPVTVLSVLKCTFGFAFCPVAVYTMILCSCRHYKWCTLHVTSSLSKSGRAV
jgi:hypothetical protein